MTAKNATATTKRTQKPKPSDTGLYVAIVEGEVMFRDIKNNNKASLKPFRFAFLLRNPDAPLFVINRHYLKAAVRKEFGTDLKPYTSALVAVYKKGSPIAEYSGIPLQFFCLPQAQKYVADHDIRGVTGVFGDSGELLDVEALPNIEAVREVLVLWTECNPTGDMTGFHLALKRHTKAAMERAAIVPKSVEEFDMSGELALFDKGGNASCAVAQEVPQEGQIDVEGAAQGVL